MGIKRALLPPPPSDIPELQAIEKSIKELNEALHDAVKDVLNAVKDLCKWNGWT